MSVSFKQFNAFIEASADQEDQLVEGWFSDPEKKKAAELERLKLQAAKGDFVAKAKLRDMEKDAEKMGAAKKAQAADKETTWKNKQAEVEAGERGTSRAYDKETGSAGMKMAPRWNTVKKEWEKYDPIKKAWIGTGDKDQYTDERSERRR